MAQQIDQTRIPLVEEHAHIEKRLVEKGIVRIKTAVDERTQWLTEELTSEEVDIERVAIDREVESPPPIREEAGVLIIPVVEQRLVIEKRWVLKEELHVRKGQRTDVIDVPVTLRASQVTVERDGSV